MAGTLASPEAALDGRLYRRGAPEFTQAREGFDLSALPDPDLVVTALTEDDVQAAVQLAAEHHLPVSVRATGHGPVPGVRGGLLIDTRALSAVSVDASACSATAAAGATWAHVLAASAPFGLIPLCGSSPAVGVAAYTQGGGLSPLGRRHGWAADRVHQVRVVTADGQIHTLTSDQDADLFWAVRGGGGNFGVTTELTFGLFPGEALYGGGIYLPGEAAPEMLYAFRDATAAAPDELSLSLAFVTFPDVDALPLALRGRFVTHLRVTFLGTAKQAESLIAPLRAVAAPLLDTVAPLPITQFGTIHGDPTRPQKVSCGSAILAQWEVQATEVLLGEIGPGSPHMLEIRHLGGALARPAAVANAVGHRDAAYNIFTSAYPGPAFDDAATMQEQMYQRLLPWTGGRSIYNFTASPVDSPTDASNAFEPGTFARLQSLKAAWDPHNTFRFDVNIPSR